MADLTITAASVLQGSGAKVVEGTAGAALTAGQALYLDSAANTWKLADTDSATAAARSCTGIALHAAGSGQPIAVQTAGSITIGATLAAGVAYYLSGTAGGICPIADVAAGDYPEVIGIATSTTVLKLAFLESGAVLL